MSKLVGVTTSKRKNGTLYYRTSITLKSKHISLGSFDNEEMANSAYTEACDIVRKNLYTLSDYNSDFALSFSKFVILINFRNSGIYFKNPIYLHAGFFYYYLSPAKYLIFDREDLFFYANHKIQIRGNYFFICDYGSQYSILSRYGIKSYAKKGIDYLFVNQNEYDFRYENIKVINEYMGVSEIIKENDMLYESKIHINGNIIIGRYKDKISAAISYNKAIDILSKKGIRKKYIKNYITSLSSEEYHKQYAYIKLSDRITNYSIEEV